jgi:hypothetical protein
VSENQFTHTLRPKNRTYFALSLDSPTSARLRLAFASCHLRDSFIAVSRFGLVELMRKHMRLFNDCTGSMPQALFRLFDSRKAIWFILKEGKK